MPKVRRIPKSFCKPFLNLHINVHALGFMSRGELWQAAGRLKQLDHRNGLSDFVVG